jgi:hypothetical protein
MVNWRVVKVAAIDGFVGVVVFAVFSVMST